MKTKMKIFGMAWMIIILLSGCTNEENSNTGLRENETVPPVGATKQFFVPGSSLSDIVVEGKNIKWYYFNPEFFQPTKRHYHVILVDPDGDVAPFTKNKELPPYYLLGDQMTFYATQTINGVESKKALAVTIHFLET